MKEEKRKITLAPLSCFYITSDDYVLEVHLPGVKKEDIEVKSTDDTICLSAPRGDVLYAGCWVLTQEVDGDNIRASLENGLLTVKVPLIRPKEAKAVPIE